MLSYKGKSKLTMVAIFGSSGSGSDSGCAHCFKDPAQVIIDLPENEGQKISQASLQENNSMIIIYAKKHIILPSYKS